MNIVHISPGSIFNDGWSYQENLLPKYQQKLGHNVTLIVPNCKFENGAVIDTETEEFESVGGFHVIRKKYKSFGFKKVTNALSLFDIRKELSEYKPDIIFFHCLISLTLNQAADYVKRNKTCKLILDNHLDYINSFKPHKRIKDRILVCIYRIILKRNLRFINKVYGVMPLRKKYAEDIFRIPQRLTDVLIMGADDENIHFSERETIRERIRKELGIPKEAFVVVSGGKIDSLKKIDNLMDAVISFPNVKLIVFGNLINNYDNEFIHHLNDNCIYVGWKDSSQIYNYYLASDLAFFPGRHSVLWEQACASKIPCVFKFYEGMEHLDVGGNASFINDDSVETIRDMITNLLFTEKYYNMLEIARSEKTNVFLYSEIAKKSIGEN